VNKAFQVIFDSRSPADAGYLLKQRLTAFTNNGRLLRDAAITDWQLFSDNMPIAGDTDVRISILQHFTYDVKTSTISCDVNTQSALRDIYRCYGPDSPLPPISKIPGAIDLRVTIAVFY
jgi:hypothetical protein